LKRLNTVILVFTLFFTATTALAESGAAPPTQRDWLVALVDGLGWSFGLPAEPTDDDYLAITSGKRIYRVEAEDAKGETDPVSVKEFTTFGPFSGRGWVSGTTKPAPLHLRFLLPLSGVYRLSASLRLPGHEIKIGDRSFTADGDNKFKEYILGKVDLQAGEQEFFVTIPPNGSLDYIELQAPFLPSISPLKGWDPDSPLAMTDIAVTAIRLLELEPFLPPTETVFNFEAETATRKGTTETTDIRHLGQPSGNLWLRAGASPTTVGIDFRLPEEGVFTLLLRAETPSTLTTTLNKRLSFSPEFPQFLKTLPLGAFFLPKGENLLDIDLPPRGGVDLLTLEKRRSESEDFCRLVGLPPTGDRPSHETMDAMLALLSVMAPQR